MRHLLWKDALSFAKKIYKTIRNSYLVMNDFFETEYNCTKRMLGDDLICNPFVRSDFTKSEKMIGFMKYVARLQFPGTASNCSIHLDGPQCKSLEWYRTEIAYSLTCNNSTELMRDVLRNMTDSTAHLETLYHLRTCAPHSAGPGSSGAIICITIIALVCLYLRYFVSRA